VVLVLLIHFNDHRSYPSSPAIEVDVQKTRTVRKSMQERLVVTVDKAQRIYLGNESMFDLSESEVWPSIWKVVASS